ncbi:MAG: molecular chaperone [Citrobacter sp.]|uniref:fimbrial biogenesis chaperone n=1 Tax=Citrobacter sp. TaxID=1896336 RepID=UPI002FCB576E
MAMMRNLILLLAALILPVTATAGVVVGGLRFIYPQRAKSLSVSLRNTANAPYLVQSKILPDDAQDSPGLLTSTPKLAKVPFIVTPPLFLMPGQNEHQLRIIATGNIPQDRESLFWLSVSAIPSVNDAEKSRVLIAFRQQVKLIWRPDALAEKQGELRWQRHQRDVIVSNDSAWYVTLAGMQINGKALTGGMVPPFSRRQQPWCPATGKCTISWQDMDDMGQKKPREHVTL